MKIQDILRLRLANQQIAVNNFETPSDVVFWLGALQAQDYPGAKWSIGLRLKKMLRKACGKCHQGAINSPNMAHARHITFYCRRRCTLDVKIVGTPYIVGYGRKASST